MTIEHRINKHEEEKLKQEACKLSIKEGSAYSFMDGFGFRYITPYALALGANNTHIGLLTSLPLLFGSIAELPAIKAMKHYSRRTLVHLGTLLQSLMWLVLIGIGASFFIFGVDHQFAPIAVIITFTILMTVGTAMHPVWTSWMKDIVPKNYNKYFGTRNKVVGLVAIGSMLVAGIILNLFKEINKVFIGFAILFLIAFIGRFISSQFFLKTYEPKFVQTNKHHLHFTKFVEKITKTNFGRYVLFSSLMNFVVAIASPFFAVYMLNDLKFNYIQFMIVSLSSLIIMFLTMPSWGKFADRYGNYKVMKITGYLIPLVPLFWLLTPVVAKYNISLLIPYLVLVEMYSGYVWAGYTLSSVDFIYDAADNEMMAPFMAYTSILNNIGLFVGALIGGGLSSSNITFMMFAGIPLIFLISGLSRYVIAGSLLSKFTEIKNVKTFRFSQLKGPLLHLHLGKVGKINR